MLLYNDDFYNFLPTVTDKSIDLVLLDLPYNILNNKNGRANWDEGKLDLVFIWNSIQRILKPNSVAVFFCNQPFTSRLMVSSPKFGTKQSWFKHHWIWNKVSAGNGLLAKYQPLKIHEELLVFMNGKTKYFPIMTTGKLKNKGGGTKWGTFMVAPVHTTEKNDQYYPKSILDCPIVHSSARRHITEKPVQLLEYMIKTYSNENELVLDFAMGSGSCGEACYNTNRQFIGIEKDQEIFAIAKERLQK